ncbi:MAG: HpcH/HpaI aldolase/citrate lyase family protein, partial [Nitrospinota bacterium]
MIALRSLLFVPGSSERMLAKAAGVEADGLILDLEDSVTPDRKAEARGLVREALGRLGHKYRVVRVNGFESELTVADLEAVVSADLDATMLPKAETPAQMRALDAHLTRLERERGLEAGRVRILPLLETARGVFACYDLLTASPRAIGVNVGAAEDADLIRDLGGRWT